MLMVWGTDSHSSLEKDEEIQTEEDLSGLTPLTNQLNISPPKPEP